MKNYISGMGEYTKALNAIMAAEQEGFHTTFEREEPVPFTRDTPVDLQAVLASDIAFNILNDASKLDQVEAIPSRFNQTTKTKGSSRITSTALLLATDEESLRRIAANLPWNGTTSAQISIDVLTDSGMVVVSRIVPPDRSLINGEGGRGIMLDSFTRQPKLLLPAVGRALNAILSPRREAT